MLCGLSDNFKPMVMAIENSSVKITADYIKTTLLQETSFDNFNNENDVAFFGGKSRKKFKPKPKHQFKCYECGEYGHFAKNCSLERKKNNEKSRTKDENVLFTSFAVSNVQSNDWFIDSGASAHMTMQK